MQLAMEQKLCVVLQFYVQRLDYIQIRSIWIGRILRNLYKMHQSPKLEFNSVRKEQFSLTGTISISWSDEASFPLIAAQMIIMSTALH